MYNKASANRPGQIQSDLEYAEGLAQISRVETILSRIPPETMSKRAIECRSYARALFYWEQHIRQQERIISGEAVALESLYEKLQDIYTQIDEPDGIEGISAHLHVLNIDQQVLEHRKASRWTAVQSWYELLLAEKPADIEVQSGLLNSLKESGQHGVWIIFTGHCHVADILPRSTP